MPRRDVIEVTTCKPGGKPAVCLVDVTEPEDLKNLGQCVVNLVYARNYHIALSPVSGSPQGDVMDPDTFYELVS